MHEKITVKRENQNKSFIDSTAFLSFRLFLHPLFPLFKCIDFECISILIYAMRMHFDSLFGWMWKCSFFLALCFYFCSSLSRSALFSSCCTVFSSLYIYHSIFYFSMCLHFTYLPTSHTEYNAGNFSQHNGLLNNTFEI